MHNLPKPNICYYRHYVRCIQVKDEVLKANLRKIYPLLESLSDIYDSYGIQSRLFDLKKTAPATYLPVTEDNLIKTYTQQMAKQERPGRRSYDQIILSAKGRCPFCSHNNPRTLDHYLPKADFPEFAVLPYNLIPCCRDCNHTKLSAKATTAIEQYLHPYYDSIPTSPWLSAQIDYSLGAPTIQFFVLETIDTITDVMLARIKKQFVDLELAELYAIQASNELSGKEHSFRSVFRKGGVQEVKNYLATEKESWEKVQQNCWQTTFYKCLMEDDKFCRMDWTL